MARRRNPSRSVAANVSYEREEDYGSEDNEESIPLRKPRRSSRRESSSSASSGSDDSESSSKNAKRRRVGRKDSSISESKLDDTSEEEDGSSADEESEVEIRRPSRSGKSKNKSTSPPASPPKRQSSRARKFTKSYTDPCDSLTDLGLGRKNRSQRASSKLSSSSDKSDDESSDDDINGNITDSSVAEQKKTGNTKQAKVHALRKASPRKHQHNIRVPVIQSEDDASDEVSSSEEEIEEEGSEVEIQVEHIIASKSLKRSEWISICKDMRTSEIENGSRFLPDPSDNDPSVADNFEERFLIKWNGLSHIHCSWELESDMANQLDCKRYFTTFFNKNVGGLRYSADERGDGDYFDPAWQEIDRILEIGDDDETEPLILDEKDSNFEHGKGRQFLIKWCNSAYSDSTYEYERDLIWNGVIFEDHIASFELRSKKPSKSKIISDDKEGEKERRRLYKVFGENLSTTEEVKEKRVGEFIESLQKQKFKNGGSLRDYQAEGIAWMMSSFINNRGGILADEMGLGKTLQTAAFVNYLVTKLKRRGPYLIIAPLSTLPHWQREFLGWTDLNALVYHGTAEDRQFIRELEFAFEEDRPESCRWNYNYLKGCHPRNYKNWQKTWQAQVVITTPEVMICDDYSTLSACTWGAVVIDEAHRLKNSKSKLALTLRDSRFTFKHKLLLTGTPIQNNMQELFSLLSIADPATFYDEDEFEAQFGEMKDKETADQLHEVIRPYILRRLKEDVEKSVPPKEETVIEVELTSVQKKFYRALFEKNVGFLNPVTTKGSKKFCGPSLMNLCMELRKCCNHTFLIKGAEDELRRQEQDANSNISEGDFLVRASGKLVLLDKLLPYLRENGHRVLLFSQFKIMLDIIEDYLHNRDFSYERIDGNITGLKRQKAIDRFQSSDSTNRPFVMLISTKAGGVGINLTAADTCIIFDSDWNPQNDLQAQARCHRIGQTKQVKVYRLIARKTYEMQMFHKSSLKMGLDQAVLQGIENSSGEGGLSKEEVERLLRHGAYEIFSEGTSDNSSAEFAQASIDSIFEQHSKKIVHKNTGTGSKAAGGTFSKASFKVGPAEDGKGEDVDIDDPDFWSKMVGEAKKSPDNDIVASGKRRRRKAVNYKEDLRQISLTQSDNESGESAYGSEDAEEDEASSDDESTSERSRWGGKAANEWEKIDCKNMLQGLLRFGYAGIRTASGEFFGFSRKIKLNARMKNQVEHGRMLWALTLQSLLIAAKDTANKEQAKLERAQEKNAGGSLTSAPKIPNAQRVNMCLMKLFQQHKLWLSEVLNHANIYIRNVPPRSKDVINSDILGIETPKPANPLDESFNMNIWPQLHCRGWKRMEHPTTKLTWFAFGTMQYPTSYGVLQAIPMIHPELTVTAISVLQSNPPPLPNNQQQPVVAPHNAITITPAAFTESNLQQVLHLYAPLQLIMHTSDVLPATLCRRLLAVSFNMHTVRSLFFKYNTSELLYRALAAASERTPRSSIPQSTNWITGASDYALFKAIMQHGWCELTEAHLDISKDKNIDWAGEKLGIAKVTPPQTNGVVGEQQNEVDRGERALRTVVALRAVAFLNSGQAELDVAKFKHFNLGEVSSVYGLTETASGQFDHSPVNLLSNMQAAAAITDKLTTANTDTMSFPPPRHELARRARLLISCIDNAQINNVATASNADDSNGNSDVAMPKYGFMTIKKDAVPNDTLLYFLVLSLLKLPSKESIGTARALLQACKEEAIARSRDSNMVVAAKDKDNGTKNRYEKIAEHLRLVEYEMKGGSVRLWRNVLRAILGVDPIVQNSSEKLFPDVPIPAAVGTGQLALSTVTKSGAKSVGKSGAMVPLTNTPVPEANGVTKVTKKRKKTKESKTSFAETFISKSLAAFKKQQLSGNVETSASANGITVPITQLESLLLSVVVSQGLPVFSEKWEGIVDPKIPLEHNHAEYNITFHGMSNVLLLASKHWLKISELKLADTKMKLSQMRQGRGKISDADMKKASEAHLASKNDAEVKAALVQEVETLVKDQYKLTRYTIMLLETLRCNMGAVILQGSSSAKKTTQQLNSMEGGLGTKVLDWQKRELCRWASKLQCEDGGNRRPMAQTEYTRVSASDQSKVPVAAKLDRKGCRAIFTQVAQQTRLRSVFFKNGKFKASKMIIKAVKQSEKALDVWHGRPGWWRVGDFGAPDDTNMLDQLLKVGYSGFSTASVFKERLAHAQCAEVPTKAAFQPRVYQIVREIAAIQDSEDIGEIIANNRKSSHVAKTKHAGDKKNGSIVQPGLESFFTCQGKTKVDGALKSSYSDSKVIVVDDEVPDAPSSQSGSSKRKDQYDGAGSAEKKAKVAAQDSVSS
uniref:Uncharacterized protein n=1 Tax=Leptocylindrus danicus TaxID=163516 RepID=A0A7S2K935_9STRA|mmetsp:Transcript_19420/g.28924  ORF Transcript_19420/g.28924 Transcript_19420/m.28924 type:complete len:2327 (+) Transcript_19420:190-7170(+)